VDGHDVDAGLPQGLQNRLKLLLGHHEVAIADSCRGIRRISGNERVASERGCLIYDALYEELKAQPNGQG
jgi:hypothetical protein